jgi:hypothetical protein
MRKVLTALAGAALTITLFAPAAQAAPPANVAHHHRCHDGLLSEILSWLV